MAKSSSISPEAVREFYEERAAILEYEAGFSRKEAESLSRREVGSRFGSRVLDSLIKELSDDRKA
jgi:hypothetical protein